MKKFYLFVAAALALGSCSSDEFLGENLPVTSGNEGAITFSGFKPNMHRASTTATTGTNAAKLLDYNFSVLGTKTVAETGGADKVSNVFAHVGYDANGIADASLYDVWYGTATGTTTTNPKTWEYVGSGAQTTPKRADQSTTFTPTAAQTIKYWDYAAKQYDFVAYANTTNIPTSQITVVKAGTAADGFSIKANATQLAGFYIADKKVMKKGEDYGLTAGSVQDKDVEFTFRSAGAKVRLGIYETIPGYKVTSITFRSVNNANFTASKVDATTAGNAKLDGHFIGSTVAEVNAAVTFETDGKAKLEFAGDKTNFFDFGAFNLNAAMGVTSTNPSWTNQNYTNVIPNVSNVGTMTLYVDYVLTSEGTNETITVKGAKAIVPKEYMSWKPNHAYTYLFKITDETNGSTGTEGTDPAGLYPITFDACVETTVDDETLGTTTTVADYSITTYQDGSVASGVEYKINKAIDIVVKKVADGSLLTLSDANFEIYSGVGANVTEADLDTSAGLGTAAKLTSGVNISGTKATFTPGTAGRYAVKVTEGGKTYWKIIEVVS